LDSCNHLSIDTVTAKVRGDVRRGRREFFSWRSLWFLAAYLAIYETLFRLLLYSYAKADSMRSGLAFGLVSLSLGIAGLVLAIPLFARDVKTVRLARVTGEWARVKHRPLLLLVTSLPFLVFPPMAWLIGVPSDPYGSAILPYKFQHGPAWFWRYR
jgi:hypothetical protein